MIDLLDVLVLTCLVNITKTIMEQLERIPKHEATNDETIATADILFSLLLWVVFNNFLIECR